MFVTFSLIGIVPFQRRPIFSMFSIQQTKTGDFLRIERSNTGKQWGTSITKAGNTLDTALPESDNGEKLTQPHPPPTEDTNTPWRLRLSPCGDGDTSHTVGEKGRIFFSDDERRAEESRGSMVLYNVAKGMQLHVR